MHQQSTRTQDPPPPSPPPAPTKLFKYSRTVVCTAYVLAPSPEQANTIGQNLRTQEMREEFYSATTSPSADTEDADRHAVRGELFNDLGFMVPRVPQELAA
jgi:hypothetical protein